MSSVAGSEIGKASGTFNMLRYLGGVFGIAVLVAVFGYTGSFRSGQAFSEGFAWTIGASAGLSVVAAIAGMWLPRGVMVPTSAGASGAARDTARPCAEPSSGALRIDQQSSAA